MSAESYVKSECSGRASAPGETFGDAIQQYLKAKEFSSLEPNHFQSRNDQPFE